jgi:hypothetical protein
MNSVCRRASGSRIAPGAGRRLFPCRLRVFPEIAAVTATDCTLKVWRLLSDERERFRSWPRLRLSHHRGLLHVGIRPTPAGIVVTEKSKQPYRTGPLTLTKLVAADASTHRQLLGLDLLDALSRPSFMLG